jgi:hypothetical protein
LSVGGNDIGFSGLVAWTSLRPGTASRAAKFFGDAVSAQQFGRNMKDDLPEAYAKLAKAIEVAVPLPGDNLGFDASRVVLSAYPDILADEAGEVCRAGEDGDDALAYPANQSLDHFSSWFVLNRERLEQAHAQLAELHQRMQALAEDHGWTFGARSYVDAPFRGHGFCAQNQDLRNTPAEALQIPCWRAPGDAVAACETSWRKLERSWLPYEPAQAYPYVLRQRWVRTFNDVYMIMNSKVITKSGAVDEAASAAAFSETTGAMHPTAEGHAAMADALLLDLRARIAATLGDEP